MSSVAPRRLRLVLAAALAVLLLAPISWHGLSSRAVADDGGIIPAGTFHPVVLNPAYDPKTAFAPYAQSVQPVVAHRQRLLYAVDNYSPGMVAVYDLDTLRPKSRHGLMLARQMQTYLFDDATNDLTLIEGSAGGATAVLQVVGYRQGGPSLVGTMPLNRALGDPTQRVVGVAPSATPGIVFLLSAGIDATGVTGSLIPASTRIHAVDLRRIAGGQGRVLWSEPLPNCRVPAVGDTRRPVAPFGYAPRLHAIYFGCSSQGSLGVGKAPDPVGVGRVSIDVAARMPTFAHFELFPKYADFSNGAPGVFDPNGGRLVLQEQVTSTGVSQIDGFDSASNAYIGSVGAGPNILTAAGLDGVHSRFYGISYDESVGLLSFDLGQTPLAQGVNYPQLTHPPGIHPKGGQTPPIARSMDIAVDPDTGRLFLGYSSSDLDYINVFRDTTPYFHEPAPPDPDANTIDVAESPGRTGAQYAGSAQGYGAFYRQVGGTHNLMGNLVPADVNVDVVGGGTRELDTAYLDSMNLDTSEASTSAIADDRDTANTDADLQKGHVAWPYLPASCADFGSTPKDANAKGVTVACNATRQKVTAAATGGGSAVTMGGSGAPDIGVASSLLDASSRLDPKRGVVTVVTSIARGINVLDGVLRVGQVTASVEVWAHGRPGTAGSRFTRTLQDVELSGRQICSTRCSPDAIAAQVNEEFAGRLRIDFPRPDAALAKGSKGGYQTVVRRSQGQQIEEVNLNDHPANRVEVPGLALTIYQDNTLPSRTLAYFAGVEAEAYYGIYLLDSAGGPATKAAVPGDRSAPNPAAGGPAAKLELAAQGGAAPPPPTIAGGPSQLLPSIAHGLQVLANSVARFFRLFGVWFLLLVPVYLSARRWALLSRSHLYGGPR